MKEYLQFDLSLAEMIAATMHSKGLTVSVAESCTGGFVSTFFTSISGASRFFKGSITTYSNASKNQFLDVSNHDIDTYSVVSKEVVQAMASNIRVKFNTDYGLATTGYVDNSNLQDTEILRAWIAIASNNKIISECVFLDKHRLQNISKVSHELLSLFVKEIV